MIALGAWLFYFQVIFTSGQIVDIPSNDLRMCNDIRRIYLTKPGVAWVSPCREIGHPQ